MSYFSGNFSGIWVPLVTPFTADGGVDQGGLAALVRQLTDAGIDGFVVLGTTGEPAALDPGEKRRVLDIVLASCGQSPVVMGASGMTPGDVCEQIDACAALPLAGFLVTPPYYVRPSQQALVEFFAEVAAATPRPIIVYDIPYRTGVEIELQTLRTLARIRNIRALKDCGGDARKTQALIADAELDVLAGEDHLVFTTLCQGGAGAIAASAHLHPRLFVAMYRAVRSARLEAAREIHHALAPMIDALFAEPNPAPLKAVLATLGQMQPVVRRPLLAATSAAARSAGEAYHRVTQSNPGTNC